MLLYINYPNSKLSIHYKCRLCPQFQKHKKKNQQLAIIGKQNFMQELTKFWNKTYKFGAKAACNDMWVDLQFPTPQQNILTVKLVELILKQRYGCFTKTRISRHC